MMKMSEADRSMWLKFSDVVSTAGKRPSEMICPWSGVHHFQKTEAPKSEPYTPWS